MLIPSWGRFPNHPLRLCSYLMVIILQALSWFPGAPLKTCDLHLFVNFCSESLMRNNTNVVVRPFLVYLPCFAHTQVPYKTTCP